MEIPRFIFTTGNVLATRVSPSSEPQGSPAWRESARLAARIANNEAYQAAVKRVWDSWDDPDNKKALDALKETDKIAVRKFGDQPFFSPQAVSAAYSVVFGTFVRSS